MVRERRNNSGRYWGAEEEDGEGHMCVLVKKDHEDRERKEGQKWEERSSWQENRGMRLPMVRAEIL